MAKNLRLLKNSNGFTLVELMVTVFLTAIAVISIYRGYTAFSQAADAQQQIMEMQQNLRIGMSWLVNDLRRAGINEEDKDVAGFIACDDASVEFSMDLGSDNGPIVFGTDTKDNDNDNETNEDDEWLIGDGDVNDDGEKVKYYLDDEDVNDNGVLDAGEDLNGNGLIDKWLMRQAWVGDPTFLGNPGAYGVAQKVISNVEALEFIYWKDEVIGPPHEAAATLTTPLSASDLKIVDWVDITLVVRTTNEDYRYTDLSEYKNLDGDVLISKPGDNFRRRAFSMTVKIRNNI